MENFIQITEYPVQPVLDLLLTDHTTKANIVFATDSYAHLGSEYQESCQIKKELLSNMALQPRVLKRLQEQRNRTVKRAEVMTSARIVNEMNNLCDEAWFGYKDVFNKANRERWITNKEKITFPKGTAWQQYAESMRLETACGEAPYLVSRYDTTTGESIPVKDRIGQLDRKLRVVGENTNCKEEWLKWTIRAFQSTYGYEVQGDSVLISRCNLLCTFADHMEYRWKQVPTVPELREVADIISWNIWQMDGITDMVPFKPLPARIYDWKSGCSLTFQSLKNAG